MFTVSDPRQKMMAYMMPIIFTFMFNNLPSGVALYYLMFNLFGLAQQFYITKIAKPITLESIKVDPKKKKSGGIMAKLQEMEKTASATRRQQYIGKK
jgi:YidC/Oxa1 family membrane protein insertase